MSRLVLVRHRRAAADWNEGGDPGLDDAGRHQAEAAAEALAPLGPLPVVVSPLRRTRETAAALERRWGVAAVVDPGVGEVLTPDGITDRSAWLRELMAGTWSAATDDLQEWRGSVVDALTRIDGDAVVVTHFVAINVAVGAATDDDRVMCFVPDNCSRTVLDVRDGHLHLVELGEQARRTEVG